MEYQIKFGAIELLSKTIAAPSQEQHEPSDYNFNFSVGINASRETKIAMVITEISIVLKKDNSVCAKFQTVMVFEFPEFDQVFKLVEDKKFDISEDLEIMLKSVGLSTTRGIIYSEVRGTYLHNVVMPLIDIPGLVKKDRLKAKENV